MAVPGRGPLAIVAALGPARRGHLRFHDRGHHLQAGPDRQGQQALAHLTGQLCQRHAHRVGHGGLARVDLLVLVVLAHGGPLPRGVLGGSPEYLPHGRAQAGDRHLKFHESRDNLQSLIDLNCVRIGRSVERVWSKSGAPVSRPRNGVRVCSRTPATLSAVQVGSGGLPPQDHDRARPIFARGARGQGVSRTLLPQVMVIMANRRRQSITAGQRPGSRSGTPQADALGAGDREVFVDGSS